MDLFTTFLNLTGLKVPDDRVVDGLDLSGSLVRGEEFQRPVFFYRGNTLFAVRFGPYKMHLWTWTTPQSELDLVCPSFFIAIFTILGAVIMQKYVVMSHVHQKRKPTLVFIEILVFFYAFWYN